MPELTEYEKGLYGADWRNRKVRNQFAPPPEPEPYRYQEYPKVVKHHEGHDVTVHSVEHEAEVTTPPIVEVAELEPSAETPQE